MWQDDVPHKLLIAVKHVYVATPNSAKPQKTAILENGPAVASNATVPHNAKIAVFRVVWHESTPPTTSYWEGMELLRCYAYRSGGNLSLSIVQ